MKKIVVLLISVLSFTVYSQAQQLADGIAAIVGKEIVLRSEIQQYMQTYIMQNKIQIKPGSPQFQKLKMQTLDRLIEQKLLLAKAEEDTLQVDEQMLDIKKIKKDTRKVLAEQLLVEQVRAQRLRELKVSRREVENFYKTYKDSLPVVPETIDISHILMQIKPSEDAQQKGLQKAEKILQELKNGANFEELAAKYSDDPASAKRGGDLGTISRGDFVPEFENTAYKLKDGQISDIVQTQFGFHIIQMIERRGEKIHTRHILVRVVPTQEDEQKVIQKLAGIKKEIENGADFGAMALKYSDDKNVAKDKGHLGLFEKDRMAIPQFTAVLSKMKPGDISDPFKTDYGYHIVRLNARNEGHKLTLKDDWAKIKEFALNFKMEKEYKSWIEELKKNVPIDIRKPI